MNCSTTATVKHKKNGEFEAKISGVDNENVYFQRYFFEKPGAIPNSEIENIDHPGNIHFFIGMPLIFYSILLISNVNEFSSYIPGIIGLPISVWGGKVWLDSKLALRNRIEKQSSNLIEDNIMEKKENSISVSYQHRF